MPGVDVTTARLIIAELGLNMTVFGDAAHAASFAGLCPGNKESAGKRFSGQTRKGNRYLRRGLVQSAWSAARTNNCFLSALFRRVAHKHGTKKAIVAVAHRILVIAFSIIRDGTEYYERGGDHFDQLHPERTANKLLRRLERIGFEVTVKRPVGRPRKDPALAPPRIPEGSCPRCWKLGITGECFHLIKRFKKSQRSLPPPANSES
jgi:transposase